MATKAVLAETHTLTMWTKRQDCLLVLAATAAAAAAALHGHIPIRMGYGWRVASMSCRATSSAYTKMPETMRVGNGCERDMSKKWRFYPFFQQISMV